MAYEPEKNRTYDVSQISRLVCPQLSYGVDPSKPGDLNYLGQEDCLVLNVYVPEKILNGAEQKASVLFFIHGGGLGVGCGNYGLCTSHYLIDTINRYWYS